MNVTNTGLLLFALIPTSRSWLLPVPALKPGIVIRLDEDVVPDVDWTLFSVTLVLEPPDELEPSIFVPLTVSIGVVVEAVFDGALVPTELIADTLPFFGICSR